jgi:hypothetical protein
MDWEHWIVCDRNGVDCFTPVEPQPDGSVNVVYGFAFITNLEGLQKCHPVKTVLRVDDEYEMTNPRPEFDPDNLLATSLEAECCEDPQSDLTTED